MLQQLLPLPGFVPIGPANDLAPDPFEGLMPRFLELPLRMYFAECKMPRVQPIETPALEVVAAPEPPPEPRPRLAVPARTSKRAQEKAKRRSRLRNMHGRRH